MHIKIMTTNIDVSLINSQLINKKKEYDKNIKHNESESKILLYDFFSVNEINISKKIKNIPYNANYFDIMLNYNLIDISKIDENLIENIDLNEDKKYILFYYNNEKCVDFQDFLFNLSNIKHFISSLLDSYTNLLHSLIKLNDENICFFGLNTDNIVFSNNNTLILKNFKNSLLISNLNESYIKNIIKNIDNYTYKPLEIHVLFYLIKNNEETLSLSFIETICSNYVKNMNILLLFSQKYIESYEKTCVETLKKYINKPKSVIITDILEYNKYWDNYSISILYLHIIGNITRFFSLKATFLNKFTMLLTKNIHPNPLKRETLEETIKSYNKLFNESEKDDWSFINDVSNEKLKKLYDYLLK
jgi:hypothetical protein